MWNKNKAFRNSMIAMLVLILIGLVIWNSSAQITFRRMSEEYYASIAALIATAKKQYPELKEEEWIQILNETEGQEEGRQLLRQYGIFPDDIPVMSQKKYQAGYFMGGNLLLVLIGGGILIVFIRYQSGRDRQIRQLTEYIRQIEQGVYALNPEENAEDELSGLKNELYKIMVMLKEAAELSGRQKKALADSVSDISHQLKTPLTSVMVLLDNLSDGEHMEETTRRRFLSEITRQITNVNWLVATLLKLSRLDAGVVEFQRQEISVEDLMEEVTDNLAIMAEWKQITLQRKGTIGVTIWGDAHWLGEALTNLIKNAVEHSPSNASVLIQVEDNTVYTAISVIDFGEGITEEEQKHIFERFYRAKSAKKDSVGIGLALCKEIVERQNGYISISSEPGAGTEFKMKFLKS